MGLSAVADAIRGSAPGRRGLFDRPWMRERVYPADLRWGPYRPDRASRAAFYAGAVALYAASRVVRHTVRRQVVDEARLSPDQSAIYCIWHADTVSCITLFVPERRLVCMIGDAWRIAPVRIASTWMGVHDFVFGQSGDGGRAAAEQVVEALRSGFSTVITPDGPRGPNRVLKRGVLHMAARSGAPIVVVNLDAHPRWVMPGQWDDKWFLLPFGRVRVHLHPPLYVTPADLDRVDDLEALLYDRLGR